MNCPYCNHKMEAGYIKTPKTSQWLPASEKNIFKRWVKGVRLSGYSYLANMNVAAYYCSHCGKIIINV